MAKRDGKVLKDSERKYIHVQANDAVYYESVGPDDEHYECLNNRHANIHIYSDVQAEEVNSGAKVENKSHSARISISRKVAFVVCAGFVVVCIILCVVSGLVVYTISKNSHRPLEEKSQVEQNETDGLSSSGWSKDRSSGWSNWSLWGQCTTTCDCGLKFRYRTCDSPEPTVYVDDCEGEDTDSAECCIVDCSDTTDYYSST